MNILQSIFVELVILALIAITPGLSIVVRLRIPPMLVVPCAVGGSLFSLYLFCQLVFLLRLPQSINYIYLALVAILLAVDFRNVLSQMRRHVVCKQLRVFGAIWAITFLIIATTNQPYGGRWAGDNIEHFERCLYYLGELGDDYKYLGIYHITARPPMMNMIGAFVMSLVGKEYAHFQVVFHFLNCAIVIPLFVFSQYFAGRRRVDSVLFTGLMTLSPVLVNNLNFGWTKLFCGCFVLLGVLLYLRGISRKTPRMICGGAMFLGVAAIVHYSAAPYLVAIFVHQGFLLLLPGSYWKKDAGPLEVSANSEKHNVSRRESRDSRQVAYENRRFRLSIGLFSGSLCCLVLCTWFIPAVVLYGATNTFASNSSVQDAQSFGFWENIEKIAKNCYATIVPHPFRVSQKEFDEIMWQPSRLGYLRDYWFMVVQVSLFPMIGSSLGLIVGGEILKNVLPKMRVHWEPMFWVVFIGVVVPVGIAVHGAPDEFGLGHICLQPLALLGVGYGIAVFPLLSGLLQHVVLWGVCIDSVLGVLLHVKMMHWLPIRSEFGGMLVNENNPGLQPVRSTLFMMQSDFVPLAARIDSIETVLTMIVYVVLGVLFVLCNWRSLRCVHQFRVLAVSAFLIRCVVFCWACGVCLVGMSSKNGEWTSGEFSGPTEFQLPETVVGMRAFEALTLYGQEKEGAFRCNAILRDCLKRPSDSPQLLYCARASARTKLDYFALELFSAFGSDAQAWRASLLDRAIALYMAGDENYVIKKLIQESPPELRGQIAVGLGEALIEMGDVRGTARLYSILSKEGFDRVELGKVLHEQLRRKKLLEESTEKTIAEYGF